MTSRVISTPMGTELGKVITQVGYLLSLSTSPVLRWCNIGTRNWNSMVFVEFDFSIDGLGENEGGPTDARLRAQNVDSAIAAAFLNADMSTVVADVWQVAGNAVAAADPVKLGTYLLGEASITLRALSVPLIPQKQEELFAPRRRLVPAYGFKHALPDYTQIAWEGDIYISGTEEG